MTLSNGWGYISEPSDLEGDIGSGLTPYRNDELTSTREAQMSPQHEVLLIILDGVHDHRSLLEGSREGDGVLNRLSRRDGIGSLTLERLIDLVLGGDGTSERRSLLRRRSRKS